MNTKANDTFLSERDKFLFERSLRNASVCAWFAELDNPDAPIIKEWILKYFPEYDLAWKEFAGPQMAFRGVVIILRHFDAIQGGIINGEIETITNALTAVRRIKPSTRHLWQLRLNLFYALRELRRGRDVAVGFVTQALRILCDDALTARVMSEWRSLLAVDGHDPQKKSVTKSGWINKLTFPGID